MKVKELIEQLQGFDPELMVVRPGYEGGVTEVEYATGVLLALNVHDEWYYGEHEEVDTEAIVVMQPLVGVVPATRALGVVRALYQRGNPARQRLVLLVGHVTTPSSSHHFIAFAQSFLCHSGMVLYSRSRLGHRAM